MAMRHAATLAEVVARGRRVADHRPWPRAVLDRESWSAMVARIAETDWTLTGLWAEPAMVHVALHDETGAEIAVLSLDCPDRRFPSLAIARPSAIRLERAISDLFALVPEGLPDTRPWLDHGKWGIAAPLGQGVRRDAAPSAYRFLAAEGEGLHQIPVGPVHAGIIEPGHFRFHANGETVVRLEQRLGYVHKGIEGLLAGAPLDRASRIAARVSGDSTVAFSFAFARAAEAAAGIEPPPRAQWLRALMAELERLANHFGDFGAICNDASFALLYAHCGVLRESILQESAACFGHRLMMDCVAPGGVARDLDEPGRARLSDLAGRLRSRFAELFELYDNTASLLDRTEGTGILPPALVRKFGAGGFVGRASGRAFDARRSPGYPPYGEVEFEVPVLTAGDVNARLNIRAREVEQSLGLVRQILNRLPPGPVRAAFPDRPEDGEGMAVVEGFRGDILVWLRLKDGHVSRGHLRDPSWFQWPLLEAAVEGNIVADFPLCNKSFNCSYSGHDL
jgi:Ni,Fe-hydrogenase III large subunit